MWYYQSSKDDNAVITELNTLAEQLPTRGFDAYYGRLREAGFKWNRKKVLRVYRKMKLGLRRKRKRRLPARIKRPLNQPIRMNKSWSADFMSDALDNGRRIRVLNIIDDYNREAIWVDAQFHYPAARVVRALEIARMERGLPDQIRVDNGPEFLSKEFRSYCKKHEVNILYIQAGKPTQNAYIERFNRLFREDILDAYLFTGIEQVRVLSESWKEDYNNNHPHKSLGGISPLKYLYKNGGNNYSKFTTLGLS
jgi:putative transposase